MTLTADVSVGTQRICSEVLPTSARHRFLNTYSLYRSNMNRGPIHAIGYSPRLSKDPAAMVVNTRQTHCSPQWLQRKTRRMIAITCHNTHSCKHAREVGYKWRRCVWLCMQHSRIHDNTWYNTICRTIWQKLTRVLQHLTVRVHVECHDFWRLSFSSTFDRPQCWIWPLHGWSCCVVIVWYRHFLLCLGNNRNRGTAKSTKTIRTKTITITITTTVV